MQNEAIATATAALVYLADVVPCTFFTIESHPKKKIEKVFTSCISKKKSSSEQVLLALFFLSHLNSHNFHSKVPLYRLMSLSLSFKISNAGEQKPFFSLCLTQKATRMQCTFTMDISLKFVLTLYAFLTYSFSFVGRRSDNERVFSPFSVFNYVFLLA
jgi:hypothetical protein